MAGARPRSARLRRPVELRLGAARRDHRPAGTGPAVPAHPRRRGVELRRPARAGEPDRARPGRRPRPGAGQPGAAARVQRAVAGRVLVRRAEGRRRRGDHDAAAARRRAGHDGADVPAGGRPVRRAADRGPAEGGHPGPPDGDLRRRGRPRGAPGGGAGRLRRRRHRGRRRRPAGLHLRHDGAAEGDHALPPRRAGHRRHVLRAPAAPASRRRVHRVAADRLHLRARRPGGVPAAGRRERAAAGEGDAGPARRRDRAARRHRAVHRTDGLQGDPRRGRREQARRGPSRRLRGRGTAGSGLAGGARGHRIADHRRDRGDRDAAHLHRRRRRRHPPRARRGARSPGTPPPSWTTTADPSPTERRGTSPSAGRPGAATWAGTGRRSTSGTAGTSPATPTCATPRATSTTRPAPTT